MHPPLSRCSRLCALAGATSALLAVIVGAFAAHALKQLASPMLALVDTGARYQMTHALALLAVAWLNTSLNSRLIPAAGILFVLGTLFFSGSLYTMALGGPPGMGVITPLGGLCLIAGWACVALAAWRGR
jgi:uncharacterized membrane protein YgdD (TMEM256/DUF423 family)